ncbi:MAG: hypothetical protein AABY53_10735 [Bdellovibrionota bacterium]
MKKLLATITALTLLSLSAHAGILIDPYIGYTVSGSTSSNFTITGSDMGARLGFTNMGLGFGVDATVAGTHTYKDATTSTDYTRSNMGVFVSYHFPILVRGYATYFVNSKISSSAASATGTATKLGVQYTGFPLIAIGVEYYNMAYKDAEIGGIKFTSSVTESQTRLALSVPFNL